MSKLISVELEAIDKLTPTLTKAMLNLSGVSDLSQKVKENLGKLNTASRINTSQLNAIKKYQDSIKAFDKATLDHQKALSSGVHKTIEKTSKSLEKATHNVDRFKDGVGFALKEFGGDLEKAVNHFKTSNKQLFEASHQLEQIAYRKSFNPAFKKPLSPSGSQLLIDKAATYAAPAYLGYKLYGGYKRGVEEQSTFEKAVASAGTVFHAPVGSLQYNKLLKTASSKDVSLRGVTSVDAAHILAELGRNEYSLDLSSKILPHILDLMAVAEDTAENVIQMLVNYNADLTKEELNREPSTPEELEKSTSKFQESVDQITQMLETSSLKGLDVQQISSKKSGRKLWKATNPELFALAAPFRKAGMSGDEIGTFLNALMTKLDLPNPRIAMSKYGITVKDEKTKENKPLISVLNDINKVLKTPLMKGKEIAFLTSIVEGEYAQKLFMLLNSLSNKEEFEKYNKSFGEAKIGDTKARADIKQDTLNAQLERDQRAKEAFYREVGNLFKPLTIELSTLNTKLSSFLTITIQDYLKNNKGMGMVETAWLTTTLLPVLASLSGKLFQNSGVAQSFSKLMGVGSKGNIGLFLGSMLLGEAFSLGEDFNSVKNIMKNNKYLDSKPWSKENFVELKPQKPFIDLPFHPQTIETTKTININAYGVTDTKELVDKILDEAERREAWNGGSIKFSNLY